MVPAFAPRTARPSGPAAGRGITLRRDARMNIPRLVIAGAHSGAGKTTFSLALMAALTRRGLTVRPYKTGPDYIDPAFHQAATGRASRNLDPWLLSPETLLRLFVRQSPAFPAAPAAPAAFPAKNGEGEGIAVIEGVMGLFDGLGTGSLGSTAHLASLLKAPVVLLINGEGLSLSAAALVSGYAGFRPHPHLADLRVAAVLINRASGPAHYALLRQCIEESANIPCLGWLPKNAVPSLQSRHLGLIPAEEADGLADHIDALADAAEQYLDLAALVELARSAPPLPAAPEILPPAPAAWENPPATSPGPSFSGPSRVRIGLARDKAFSFYYQDNLDLLAELGADLVPFSPLNGARLPDSLDGLYLGGGFPEIFAPELEANRNLRAETAAALEAGLPAYAECGGMLYLCSSLTVPERDGSSGRQRFAMAGFFPQQAEMTPRLQPFGYVTLTLREDCLLGPAGTRLRAHEFHYSRLTAPEPPLTAPPAVFSAAKADGRAWDGGLSKKNTLAMFPHLHFHSCPEAAARFIERCRQYRLEKEKRA